MAKPYPQIVLFGDSLFQSASETSLGFSFQGTLQAAAIRRFDVVNRGFSGYNTANALKLLPEIFPHPATSNGRIAYLVVLFGANDAVRELPTTTQHVPLDQFKQNLIKIITHPNIVAHDPKILLVTPPPVDETQLAEGDLARHGEPTRHYSITARYAETVREAAREVPGVVLVDLWSIITELATGRSAMPESAREGGLAELLEDGLHMTGPAYRAFYSKVLPHIEGGWAHVSEDDRMGYVFPDWRVLNPPS